MTTGSGDDFAGTDRFEVVRRLGAGGMGVVYEAVDRERNTVVALKTLRTLEPDALLRFKNEFRLLADIQHRNLVGLGELFEDRERWFFTMEMVQGIHFLDYIRRADEVDVDGGGSRTVASASSAPSADQPTVEIPSGDSSAPGDGGSRRGRLAAGADEARLRDAFAQLALGLDALHRAQKVHRDIKPSNIMVTAEGRVVILDFGLVADLLNMVPEHHLVGTFSYMAPEQAGLRAVGPAADWYSVGVLLYQALTGRLPVTGAAREVLVLKQAFEPAAPTSSPTCRTTSTISPCASSASLRAGAPAAPRSSSSSTPRRRRTSPRPRATPPTSSGAAPSSTRSAPPSPPRRERGSPSSSTASRAWARARSSAASPPASWPTIRRP